MIVNYNGKDVKLPDFLIVGAAKSGTTSLHYYLKQHPQVFMPDQKELRFFSLMDMSPENVPDWLKGEDGVFSLDNYLNYFKKADAHQTIGESCPIYLYAYEDTIRNIKTVYGEKYKELKIIAILRNPAEQAWSHYTMRRKNNAEPVEDFREYLTPNFVRQPRSNYRMSVSVDYVEFGMYCKQIESFMNEFTNIKIFTYDEFCENGLAVLKDIFSFLKVDDGFIPNMKTRYNIAGDVNSKMFGYLILRKHALKDFLKLFLPKGMRRKMRLKIETKIINRKQIPDDIKKQLIEGYYKDDIVKLGKLIERDLFEWIKV